VSKLSILFVDDEPNVLHGLRLMLRSKRKEWDMAFVDGGVAALAAMEEKAYDVVVADMRMPGMDGVALLEEVRTRWPCALRIVLSGHAEYKDILKSVRPAHQFLTKPCTPEDLAGAIERAGWLQEAGLNEPLRRVISSIESLPSLPDVYFELREELGLETPSMHRIGEIISKDLGVSASLLKLVNSSFFGLPVRVSSPAQAVNLLGMDTVSYLVVTLRLFSVFDRPERLAGLRSSLWDHSFATAGLARVIAHLERVDQSVSGDCFIAGLVHDIGRLIVAANLKSEHEQIMDRIQAGETLMEAEHAVLGTSHAEVGAYLLALWSLPERVVEAVQNHHLPSRSRSSGFTPLTATHVANVLEQASIPEEGSSNASDPEPGLDMDYLCRIHLDQRLPVWRSVCMEKRIEAEGIKNGEG
jgi:putative nucleotidyltransferase with HDIG domain